MPVKPTWGIPNDGRIPALSVRSPWPWALLHWNKRVENRTSWKSCNYRGPLILHAAGWPAGDADRLAAKPTASMYELEETARSMIEMARESGVDLGEKVTLGMLLEQRGGTFAKCNLVDVISGPMEFTMRTRGGKLPESQRAWYMGGFALLLEDVLPIPFVRCDGAPGLFGIDRESYAKLQLAA